MSAGSSSSASAGLTAGEQSTRRAELRWAAPLGDGWYFKGVGSYLESDDFYRSRNETLEYAEPCPPGTSENCLPLEAVSVQLDRDQALVRQKRERHPAPETGVLGLDFDSRDVDVVDSRRCLCYKGMVRSSTHGGTPYGHSAREETPP